MSHIIAEIILTNLNIPFCYSIDRRVLLVSGRLFAASHRLQMVFPSQMWRVSALQVLSLPGPAILQTCKISQHRPRYQLTFQKCKRVVFEGFCFHGALGQPPLCWVQCSGLWGDGVNCDLLQALSPPRQQMIPVPGLCF